MRLIKLNISFFYIYVYVYEVVKMQTEGDTSKKNEHNYFFLIRIVAKMFCRKFPGLIRSVQRDSMSVLWINNPVNTFQVATFLPMWVLKIYQSIHDLEYLFPHVTLKTKTVTQRVIDKIFISLTDDNDITISYIICIISVIIG